MWHYSFCFQDIIYKRGNRKVLSWTGPTCYALFLFYDHVVQLWRVISSFKEKPSSTAPRSKFRTARGNSMLQQVFPQYDSTGGNLFITAISVPTPGNPSCEEDLMMALVWFIDFGCWVSGAIQKNYDMNHLCINLRRSAPKFGVCALRFVRIVERQRPEILLWFGVTFRVYLF